MQAAVTAANGAENVVTLTGRQDIPCDRILILRLRKHPKKLTDVLAATEIGRKLEDDGFLI